MGNSYIWMMMNNTFNSGILIKYISSIFIIFDIDLFNLILLNRQNNHYNTVKYFLLRLITVLKNTTRYENECI